MAPLNYECYDENFKKLLDIFIFWVDRCRVLQDSPAVLCHRSPADPSNAYGKSFSLMLHSLSALYPTLLKPMAHSLPIQAATPKQLGDCSFFY